MLELSTQQVVVDTSFTRMISFTNNKIHIRIINIFNGMTTYYVVSVIKFKEKTIRNTNNIIRNRAVLLYIIQLWKSTNRNSLNSFARNRLQPILHFPQLRKSSPLYTQQCTYTENKAKSRTRVEREKNPRKYQPKDN